MKIVVNTRFLLAKNLEGLGWYTLEVVQRLVRLRPDDEFIFLFDRPFDPRFVFEKNVRPVVLFPPARHPLLWWIWFEIAVARFLKTEKPALFFSPDQFLCLASKTPTILTCHDLLTLRFPKHNPWLTQLFYRHFFPKYLRRADQIIAISEATKRDILALVDINFSKITVAWNGCRDGFKPLQPIEIQSIRAKFADGQPFFFYAGAIQPRKNVARLIQAFDRFKSRSNSPAKLLLAGRFAWKSGDVKTAFDEAVFKNDIQLLGYLDAELLPKLMAAALALVFVSEAEGFGLPLLEAMHAGVPIITSNTSSLPEVAGDAALLVNPFSVEKIAAAMQQLAENQRLAADLVERGHRQKLLFSWDAHAATVSEMMGKLVT